MGRKGNKWGGRVRIWLGGRGESMDRMWTRVRLGCD